MGDSEPDVPENSRPRTREEMWVEEHFEAELVEATARTNGNIYRPQPELVG
jgi:hypothetical protein